MGLVADKLATTVVHTECAVNVLFAVLAELFDTGLWNVNNVWHEKKTTLINYFVFDTAAPS